MTDIIDTFRTISSPCEGFFKDKGSKFFAFLFPLSSPEEVKSSIEMLRDKHHDARHHCYAYRIGQSGEIFRTVDDGEPSGTAGRPILGALMSCRVTNILAVVVRYFGGTKLGTSGLIAAYKQATMDALSNAEIVEKTIDIRLKLHFGYSQINEVMRIIKIFEPEILSQLLENSCLLELKIRQAQSVEFIDRASKIEGLNVEISHKTNI